MNLTKVHLSAYFLSTGDGPRPTLITLVLDGNNYHSWSRSMKIVLRSKAKLGFVDGCVSKSNETYALFPLWNICDLMVIFRILNLVSKEIAANILYFATACEMWIILEERCPESNVPRILWYK